MNECWVVRSFSFEQRREIGRRERRKGIFIRQGRE
jgi:hypothetical protein